MKKIWSLYLIFIWTTAVQAFWPFSRVSSKTVDEEQEIKIKEKEAGKNYFQSSENNEEKMKHWIQDKTLRAYEVGNKVAESMLQGFKDSFSSVNNSDFYNAGRKSADLVVQGFKDAFTTTKRSDLYTTGKKAAERAVQDFKNINISKQNTVGKATLPVQHASSLTRINKHK
ncbi:hypothetical protein [Holospora curviuscula]|uniref:Uncharacterized protein n=1 Tax=Holospora curviuscula TaxID=1082868 RepID=A0A2S5R8Q7_9PROT|nr:hypothetical protein [Holospora curviuscula]PPE03711.1 hypothetical protein HCUR_00850 [Holospora curviuscula]